MSKSVDRAAALLAEVVTDMQAGDFEGAHSAEDALHTYVLRRVKNGDPESKQLANIALRPRGLNFPRWYA